jgi:hypothetical protein
MDLIPINNMSDGRVRSGRRKGDRPVTTAIEEAELNIRAGDTNLCVRCKEFIKPLYKGDHRIRDNRIDCEDQDGDLVSYHLACYDIEFFGKITEYTKRKLKQYEA